MKLSVEKQIALNKLKQEARTAVMESGITEAEQRQWDAKIVVAENEHLEAVKLEAGEDAIREAEGVIDASRVTAEQREFIRMFDRANPDDFLRDATIGSNSGGAAAEMRKHLLGTDDPTAMPLAALLPRDAFTRGTAEERADVATSLGSDYGAGTVEQLAARVFQGSAAAFLGIQTPTVPTGTRSYNMVLTGPVGDVRSPGVALDAVVGTVRNTDIAPARVTARMQIAREDIALIPGYQTGWENDLRGALTLERDRMILNGQAAVNNVSPAVTGILMDANITDPANPSAIALYSDYLNAFDDVDEYSDDGSNIRVLTNADAFKHARGLSVGPAASAFALLRDRVEMGPGRFRQSNAMPDVAATISKAISARIGYRGAVSPVWNRIEIINDPYSNASEGLINLTAYLLTNVGIADPKVYRHLEYKTA